MVTIDAVRTGITLNAAGLNTLGEDMCGTAQDNMHLYVLYFKKLLNLQTLKD